jgi:hypothetical protein
MEKIIKLQVALFFQAPESRPDIHYNPINNDMGNLFDGMPQIIPLPLEAPHEIPRVTLRSGNDRYNCNIAASRIDLIFNETGAHELEWPEITKDFSAKSTLFIKSVFSRVQIVRFGLVGSFFIPDKSAASSISRKYLKQDLSTAEELNLRYNKKTESHGLELNNIFSINTATMAFPQEEKGIYIERDINNVLTGTTLKQDEVISLITKFMPTYGPDQIKGLVK